MKDDASIQGKLSCVMDVEAYLRRIGLEQAPRPDQEGLMSVQRAHRWAIPFENFDIPLGRGISLDPAAVFDKLVVRRRGGYCFEQNQLFLRALLQLGFDARPLLARVWLMAEGSSEESRVGKEVSVRVDVGGCRSIKK